jgi:methyl-accepting chemotaxis protein
LEKKRSLNFKVGGIALILITGAIVISCVSINKMGDLNRAISQLITGSVARSLDIKDIRNLVDLQALDNRDIILEDSPEGITTLKKSMDGRHQAIAEDIKQFDRTAAEPEQKIMAEAYGVYLKWWDVNTEVVAHIRKGEAKLAFQIAEEKASPLRQELSQRFSKMVEHQEQLMNDESKETTAEYENARALVWMVVGFSILISMAVAVMVMMSLSKAINKILADLGGSSEQVSVASQQIASSSEQLSEASTEQAASLEETVSTLEELTSMVKVNADHAREAARLSENTRAIANKGEEEIRVLVTSMGEISKDSKKIEEIITVIDDIAFQTNLLALNAAVEAARAGEQGRGFAVVAEAVRNLAQRSASAAKDITDLIKSSVEKVERGSQQAEQSGQVLAEIVQSVKKVSEINAEISAASSEQANGITQIGKAMNQLDQVTQINAATSEEAAASAQELSSQAAQLTQVVGILAVTIKGGVEKQIPSPMPASAKAPPSSAKKENAKVIPLKENAKEKVESEEDWGMRKVGTVDEF